MVYLNVSDSTRIVVIDKLFQIKSIFKLSVDRLFVFALIIIIKEHIEILKFKKKQKNINKKILMIRSCRAADLRYCLEVEGTCGSGF